MIELDHVLIAVTDLDAAGDTYLELVAAVDTAESAGSPFGRWVAAAPSGRPLGWAVRTQGLEVIAGRLGLAVTGGSRRREDGQVLRWRLAGMEQAVAHPALPFFIEWGDGTPLPGRTKADHQDGPLRIDHVQLTGDAARLESWLGAHHLPISVQPGAPAVTDVVLAGASGSIAIPGDG